MNKLFILIGPSGVGKDTVLNLLIKDLTNFKKAISTTTRLKRIGEIEGIDYYFINKKTFFIYKKQKLFFECTKYLNNYYGFLNSQIMDKLNNNINVIAIMEKKGMIHAKRKLNNVVSIFLKPPSLKELENRLINRNNNLINDLKKRLISAEKEMKNAKCCDYVIVNDNINDTIQKLKHIINNEIKRCE